MSPDYNERPGRAMRFCGRCGVAIGFMKSKEYATRFIRNRELCPYCGKPAIKEDVDEVWLRASEVEAKYGIPHEKLSALIREGKVRWRPGHKGRGHTGRRIPEKEVQRLLRQAKRLNTINGMRGKDGVTT